jgi:CheY-like chemotaxis protein
LPSGVNNLVMIVEDDAATREAFALILTLQGYRVQAAADGNDALEMLRSGERPRLVLLDVMMPGLDGVALRQIMAEDEHLSDVPVLVCSAAGRTCRARFKTPPAGYLDKPIDPPQLLAAVQAHVNGDRTYQRVPD